MLDINRIRNNPEEVKKALLKRIDHIDFSELLEWDSERRKLIVENDEKKARRNKVSDEIPRLKKEGIDITGLLTEMKTLSVLIKENDERLRNLESKINEFCPRCLIFLPTMLFREGRKTTRFCGIGDKSPILILSLRIMLSLPPDWV